MGNSQLQKLGNYLRPYWRQVILGIIALLVVNGIGIYIPLLIKDSIDKLQTDFGMEQLWRYSLLILLLASIMLVMRMFSRMTLFGIGRQVEFDLKQKIFQHLLQLEPAYFATNTSGDLINRATSDVD
ncbi:MAG: ABC transporter transmembrane domain-containing protein, partial [Spirulinaceae cyanobacterium]